MIVDTSALVAILLQEDDAETYADAIAGAGTALLSAASYVELAIVSLSRGGRGRAELEATLADAAIEIAPVTPDQARLAADAYERYGKGRHAAALNFGDCFAYALAKSRGEPLLFKGTDFGLTDILRA
ncbi:MAG: type II toxin-antitoxin system VapC family toxin [Geminicoccaceae bacterium]